MILMEERPDPEKLLKKVKEEENQKEGGKLKIYLGAAPGVGKTYAMLQDAIVQRARGIDVVVGIAESHGREEIESLFSNLEILPRQMIDYRGQSLSEFDIDGALKRNPQLILMDEMAHTNAPGSRHKKRWQDIKELMDRKIDVCTTLNVQHIESLNDDVSKITNVSVKETVPDPMLAKADIIELVDLPPEDLIKRLQEGKVYYPERAKLAQKHFFRKGNLNALRELALRMTAERVGTQTLLYRQDEGLKQIWPTKEKILVCVGPGRESIKLIRAACRTANSLKADWVAVYVNTSRNQSSEEEKNLAIQHLRLAEQLGAAATRILTGFDIVNEILDYAHEINVTQIMIWKHIRSRWKNIIRRNLSDELVRNAGDIDIYLMTGTVDTTRPQKSTATKQAIPWLTYFAATSFVTFATILDFVVYPYLRAPNLVMVYLLAVIAVASFGQTGPAILTSILSVLAYDFFFVPPFYSFAVADTEYLFTLIVILFVTQVISHLTILTRRQTQAAKSIEQQTTALYILSQRLSNTRGIDKLLETGTKYISELLNSNVIALLPENNQLQVRSKKRKKISLNEKENSIAQWVYEIGQIAGLGTDTLPFSNALYIPLLASQGAVGVLRVEPKNQQLFTPEQMRLLEASANQIALALEVDKLQDEKRKTELQTETDRVHHSLLQSVSHDLRAPLVSIMASANMQLEMANELDPKENKKLAKNIYLESEQLSRLIDNLLQLSYLESREIKLQKQPASLRETIDAVIKTSAKKLEKKPVNITIQHDLPQIHFDHILIQEVFNNIIDNAVKFTSTNSPIDITAVLEGDHVVVSIEDRGPGIVPDEVDKLFEKFYRGRMLKTERGLGLGLAICRMIIEAHGGTIWVENREDEGAAFRFKLPLH